MYEGEGSGPWGWKDNLFWSFYLCVMAAVLVYCLYA